MNPSRKARLVLENTIGSERETIMEETKLTGAQRAVIEQLEGAQADLGKSEADFAKDHLTYSESAWNRIRSGKYFDLVKDADGVIDQLAEDLLILRREIAQAAKISAHNFIAFDDTRSIFKAIEQCKYKPLADPDRLVVYLAPTGGGKTALCSQVAKRFKACVVEARDGWRRSFFTCIRDIAIALGIRGINKLFSPSLIEERVIVALGEKKRVIAIDEGEFFGAEALNLIKLLLNKTPTVILLCAIPEAYDRWNKSAWHEASQVRRRTHKVFVRDVITPEEAIEFIAPLKLEGRRQELGILAAQFANRFGSFDALHWLVEKLKGRSAVDSDALSDAIREQKKNLKLEF